jgi:hypothetical protein
MGQFGTDVEEDLQLLDVKIKQLRNEYEQYFFGSRPREPQLLRGEVQKMVAYYANVPIQNTRLRFRFNSLQARLFAFRRHWDTVLRRIEEGSYERHLFRADLHARERTAGAEPGAATPAAPEAPAAPPASPPPDDLFAAYVEARRRCGQSTDRLDRGRLDALVEEQRRALVARHGCRDVSFRVVVEGGRAKLKATPVA